MVCSISQGTSLTAPFNLVFSSTEKRRLSTATCNICYQGFGLRTPWHCHHLRKNKKNNGNRLFWLGQYPKKLRESKSGKPPPNKKMELTDFLIGILPNFMLGSRWLQVFPYFGEGFFRSVPSLSLPLRPPKLTVMKKTILFFSRSGLKTQGPKLAGFREELVSTDVRFWGSVEMAATGVFEAWRYGGSWQRGEPWLHMCWAEGRSIAIMEV